MLANCGDATLAAVDVKNRRRETGTMSKDVLAAELHYSAIPGG